MDIIHSAPTLELGAMKRSQLNSRFVWEILGLSTPILPIITILLILFKNTTRYTLIGEGGGYCGLTLDWNYEKKYVDVSMPGYITKYLHKFQYPKTNRPQHAMHDWTDPAYGSRV